MIILSIKSISNNLIDYIQNFFTLVSRNLENPDEKVNISSASVLFANCFTDRANRMQSHGFRQDCRCHPTPFSITITRETTLCWPLFAKSDSNEGWANVGRTSGRQYRLWANVGPTWFAVWVVTTALFAPDSFSTSFQVLLRLDLLDVIIYILRKRPSNPIRMQR